MKLYAIAAAVILAVIAGAFFAGRWTAPPKYAYEPAAAPGIQATTKTAYVDRVITHVKRVTVTPTSDGGSVTTTDETTNEHATPAPLLVPPAYVALTPAQPDWHASIGVGLTFDPKHDIQYSISVERRLLGPMWIGAEITTQGAGYLKAGISF